MLPTLQPFSHPAFPADAPVPLFVVQRHNVNHLVVRPVAAATAATATPATTTSQRSAAALPNLAVPAHPNSASSSSPLNGNGGASASPASGGGAGGAVAPPLGGSDAVLDLNVDAVSSSSSVASQIEDDTDQIRYQSM